MRKIFFVSALLAIILCAACGPGTEVEETTIKSTATKEASINLANSTSTTILDETTERETALTTIKAEAPRTAEEMKKELTEAAKNAASAVSAKTVKTDIIPYVAQGAKNKYSVALYLEVGDDFYWTVTEDILLMKSEVICEKLQPYENIARLTLFWQEELIDDYGNTKDWNVLKILLKKETLDKINFKNFDHRKFEKIADSYYAHSSIK